MILSCFKCGKELNPAFNDMTEQHDPPWRGTTFTSHGHYGSTVWDPMSRHRYLYINICDQCLVDHNALVLECLIRPRPDVIESKTWIPNAD